VRQSSPLFFSIAGRKVGRIIAVLLCGPAGTTGIGSL
jgi:hypothetical protein